MLPSSTDFECTISDRISSSPPFFLLTKQILQTKETVYIIFKIHVGIIQSIMPNVRAFKTIVKILQAKQLPGVNVQLVLILNKVPLCTLPVVGEIRG